MRGWEEVGRCEQVCALALLLCRRELAVIRWAIRHPCTYSTFKSRRHC